MINPDVKLIRKRLGMTQIEFASRFEFPIGTLRSWEQRKRSPTGSARVLLMVIAQAPEVVCATLAAVRGAL